MVVVVHVPLVKWQPTEPTAPTGLAQLIDTWSIPDSSSALVVTENRPPSTDTVVGVTSMDRSIGPSRSGPCGVGVGTAVGVGVGTGVGVAVGTGVSVGVAVGTGVAVSVGAAVGIGVGTAVAVGTGVGIDVGLGVGVGTAVGVATGVGVCEMKLARLIPGQSRFPLGGFY